MSLLKMRGSAHDRMVRSYDITETGLQVGEPYDGPLEI
jgi:hypothetical protein